MSEPIVKFELLDVRSHEKVVEFDYTDQPRYIAMMFTINGRQCELVVLSDGKLTVQYTTPHWENANPLQTYDLNDLAEGRKE